MCIVQLYLKCLKEFVISLKMAIFLRSHLDRFREAINTTTYYLSKFLYIHPSFTHKKSFNVYWKGHLLVDDLHSPRVGDLACHSPRHQDDAGPACDTQKIRGPHSPSFAPDCGAQTRPPAQVDRGKKLADGLKETDPRLTALTKMAVTSPFKRRQLPLQDQRWKERRHQDWLAEIRARTMTEEKKEAVRRGKSRSEAVLLSKLEQSITGKFGFRL